MSTHDRPYSESRRDRERERSYRERDRSSGRRDDDDDRGSWMSRDPFSESRGRDYRDRDPFDPREQEIQRGRSGFESDDRRRERQPGAERSRFERVEDWERPREFGDRERFEQSGGRPGGGSSDYGYGGSAGVGPRGLPNRAGGGWHEEGASFGRGELGEGSWGGLRKAGRYAGRGPKGYQRSDDRIKEEICDRLTEAPEIDAAEIEVTVQNGEVTLQGSVPERSMKRAAEDTAESVSGVQQMHNRLRVETRPGDDDDGTDRFAPKGSEGQRSSAGRKAH
jgi:BON domain-containing protein